MELHKCCVVFWKRIRVGEHTRSGAIKCSRRRPAMVLKSRPREKCPGRSLWRARVRIRTATRRRRPQYVYNGRDSVSRVLMDNRCYRRKVQPYFTGSTDEQKNKNKIKINYGYDSKHGCCVPCEFPDTCLPTIETGAANRSGDNRVVLIIRVDFCTVIVVHPRLRRILYFTSRPKTIY